MVCRLPTEPFSSVPGAGIEPAASTFRAWRYYQQQLPRSRSQSIREEGFEPPPPDSKSGSLPVSRFPSESASRESNPPVGLGKPVPGRSASDARLIDRFVIDQQSAERDRGFEPRSPGWKPGVVPLDQSRSVVQSSSGRRGSRTLKAHRSPDFESGAVTLRLALPNYRSTVAACRREPDDHNEAPAGGVEPPIVALTGRRLTVRPHRYRTFQLTAPSISCITNSWSSVGIDWNIEHIGKHGVEPDEAELVIVGARSPFPRKIQEDKWLVWGRASGVASSKRYSYWTRMRRFT